MNLRFTSQKNLRAFDEEHKADNFHNLVRFIKDFCYAWGKPRPIHESGGILDFLFFKDGPVDHNNLSRFESVLLHQYVNDPTMMGGSKHFDAILESMRNARREAAKTATKADTGSGDMDTSTSSAVATTALAATPGNQVKPTRETLAATLAACQAALEKLDDDNDSPAAAVKKRRKSKGGSSTKSS